jgi:hypothetical protein
VDALRGHEGAKGDLTEDIPRDAMAHCSDGWKREREREGERERDENKWERRVRVTEIEDRLIVELRHDTNQLTTLGHCSEEI